MFEAVEHVLDRRQRLQFEVRPVSAVGGRAIMTPRPKTITDSAAITTP
ncbi:hypothetical protein [Sphingomonas montana]|nr:hypothetical protein [Sphingomonas montana]